MKATVIAIVAVLGAVAAARADPIDATLCARGPAAARFGLAKVVDGPKVTLRFCPPGETGCAESPARPT
jgi:hypothetical protein